MDPVGPGRAVGRPSTRSTSPPEPGAMRRAVLTVVLAVVLFMWLWALVTWSVAPDRVPLHFGLSGRPDRWGARTVASWFGMPILATAMAIGMSWLGRWSLSRPERINMPGPAVRRTLTVAAGGAALF